MKVTLCQLILLLLVAACKKDTPGSSGNNTPDSVTVISTALYYPNGDTSADPDTLSIQYNADHRIEKITQAYQSVPNKVSWTFTYNTNSAIATVKGGRLYWDSKQDYYFYYNSSGRLDSVRINDTAFGGDSMLVSNVFAYDGNSNMKSSYSYVANGGNTGYYTGDTLAKAVFFRISDLDSVRYTSYNYTHLNTTPPVTYMTSSTDAIHFNNVVLDISPLDKTFLLWLSLRTQVYAPMNAFDPFWYQYINPSVAMVASGTLNAKAYDFNAAKNGDGNIVNIALIDAGNVYSKVVSIAYRKIPQ